MIEPKKVIKFNPKRKYVTRRSESQGTIISLHDGNSFGRYEDLALVWLKMNKPKRGEDARNWISQLKYFLKHSRSRTRLLLKVELIKYLEHALTFLDIKSKEYIEVKTLLQEVVKFKWTPKGDEVI